MAIEEEVFYEGGPHIGELIFALFLSVFVITLPVTVPAMVRAIWVRYRISDRRVTVTGGWFGRNRVDLVYSEITKIVTVPRGLGTWGDMVMTLRDGSRLELRSVPKFRDAFEFMSARLSLKAQQASGALGAAQT
ncbi:MAG: PH domain-containing protein [Pseudanabaenaceae cyanobacterium bins.68]|nr:PH domain-containing protein [Pseudanabaenaceae cyanobacterium bins.68]